MKKTLLPLAAMMLLATSAYAQRFDTEFKSVTNMGHRTPHCEFAVESKANTMKRIKSDETFISYEGSDIPYGSEGWPAVSDASVVASQLCDLSKYVGWEVLGLRFNVFGTLGGHSLGDGAGVFVDSYKASGLDAYAEAELTDNYEVSGYDENNNMVFNWNEVYFSNSYKISAEHVALRYGFVYTQNTSQTSPDAFPVMYGNTKTLSDGDNGFCYLVYGTFSEDTGAAWYRFADAEYPYVPCFQIIAKDPTGTTRIIGIEGSDKPVAKQFYSLDGAKLDAPRKGVNIVKMSNGETRKVQY